MQDPTRTLGLLPEAGQREWVGGRGDPRVSNREAQGRTRRRTGKHSPPGGSRPSQDAPGARDPALRGAPLSSHGCQIPRAARTRHLLNKRVPDPRSRCSARSSAPTRVQEPSWLETRQRAALHTPAHPRRHCREVRRGGGGGAYPPKLSRISVLRG